MILHTLIISSSREFYESVMDILDSEEFHKKINQQYYNTTYHWCKSSDTGKGQFNINYYNLVILDLEFFTDKEWYISRGMRDCDIFAVDFDNELSLDNIITQCFQIEREKSYK